MKTGAFNFEYMTVVGNDTSAALMLNQIVYWYLPAKNGKPKLQVQKNGSWWIAKSYPAWQQELSLTPKQARRCVSALESRGIIETMIAKFDGAPTVHLRLKFADGKQMLKDAPNAEEVRPRSALEGISICPGGQVHLPVGAHSSAQVGISLTETTAEITSKITSVASQSLFGVKQDVKKNEKTGEPVKTAAEILEARKKAKESSTGDKTKKSLPNYWKNKLAEKGAKSMMPFGMKELSMLKRFEKDLGDKAFAAVDFAFERWWQFAKKVEGAEGEKQLPKTPTLWFMHKYRAILLEMLVQSIANAPVGHNSKVVSFAKVPVPEPIKPVSKPEESEAPYHPTWEETEAIIAKAKARIAKVREQTEPDTLPLPAQCKGISKLLEESCKPKGLTADDSALHTCEFSIKLQPLPEYNPGW
jgi:hypothetical protein